MKKKVRYKSKTKTRKICEFKIDIFLSLIILIIFFTSCNTESRPPFTEFITETPKLNDTIQSIFAPIDFYVQATSSMRGFVVPQNSVYSQVLNHMRSGAFAEQTFYRFDVANIGILRGDAGITPFYEIDTAEFNQSMRDEDFYAVSWIKNHRVYGELYRNLHDNNESDNVISSAFIAPVFQNLNSEHLSVVITDLVDYGVDISNIEREMRTIITNGASISILILNSVYYGENQALGTNNILNSNRRPFYIISVGDFADVSNYTNSLSGRLRNDNIPYINLFLDQSDDSSNNVLEWSFSNDAIIEELEINPPDNRLRMDAVALHSDERAVADSEYFMRILSNTETNLSFILNFEGLTLIAPEIGENLYATFSLETLNQTGLYTRSSEDVRSGFKSLEQLDAIESKISVSIAIGGTFNREGTDKYRLTVNVFTQASLLDAISSRALPTLDWNGQTTPGLQNIINSICDAAGIVEMNPCIAQYRFYFVR